MLNSVLLDTSNTRPFIEGSDMQSRILVPAGDPPYPRSLGIELFLNEQDEEEKTIDLENLSLWPKAMKEEGYQIVVAKLHADAYQSKKAQYCFDLRSALVTNKKRAEYFMERYGKWKVLLPSSSFFGFGSNIFMPFLEVVDGEITFQKTGFKEVVDDTYQALLQTTFGGR